MTFQVFMRLPLLYFKLFYSYDTLCFYLLYFVCVYQVSCVGSHGVSHTLSCLMCTFIHANKLSWLKWLELFITMTKECELSQPFIAIVIEGYMSMLHNKQSPQKRDQGLVNTNYKITCTSWCALACFGMFKVSVHYSKFVRNPVHSNEICYPTKFIFPDTMKKLKLQYKVLFAKSGFHTQTLF